MVRFSDQKDITRSKNPYQKMDSSDDPKSRLTSHEVKSSSNIRKQTPIKAVFSDLQTAHSSITSGHARTASGRLAIPPNLFDPPEGIEAIPLRHIERKRGATVAAASFLHNIPLPPPPAALCQERYESDVDDTTSLPRSRSDNHTTAIPRSRLDDHTTPVPRSKLDNRIPSKSQQRLPSAVKGEPGSLLANIKSALATISSPITPETNENDDKATHWPRENLSDIDEKKTRGYMPGGGERSSVPYPDNDFSIYHSSHGEAPSGSLAPSSNDSPRNVSHTHTNPYMANRHSLYTPYNGEVQSPLRKSTSEETPKRHSYDIQRATSTVGNIYKHYIRSNRVNSYDSDSEDDINEESPLRDGINIAASHAHRPLNDEVDLPNATSLRPSALNVRKQRRAERPADESQPPDFTLPEVPILHSSKMATSPTEGILPSSSYGDTHKLLDLTQPTSSTTRRALRTRTNDLKMDEEDSEDDITSRFPMPNALTTPHGYTTPKVIVSPADDPSVNGDDPHWEDPIISRQPLEREVSKALRRASGYSAYSMESMSTAYLENSETPQQQRPSNGKNLNFSRRFNVEATPPSDAGSLNSEQREFVAQAQAFYDRGAIAPNWITAQHQNVVRIPISHSGNLPDSPPDSPHEIHTQAERQETPNEQEDWETVAESAIGALAQSRQQTPGMMGGLVNRAGSSIADVSDDGTESTDPPHIDEYGSTERIAQHPGNIQYFGDYRQRDLKKTHIPVFLPVFREHKVNGYLADSNRTRPPPNYYNYNPQPLQKSHTNPFQSPPPEVMKYAQNPSSRGRNLNLFPPSLHTSEESADFTRSNQLQQSSKVKVSGSVGRLRFDWTSDIGEPGPAITPSSEETIESRGLKRRTSSWRNLFVREHSASKDLELATQSTEKSEGSQSKDTPVSGGLQEHKPLAKRPPGAFYRDLRSSIKMKNEPKRSLGYANRPALLHQRNSSIKNYPTNTLRPLALLASSNNTPSLSNRPIAPKRPSTPVQNRLSRSDQEDNANTFIYRSPLAPPKRPSWQDLYSRDELKGMQDAAKADGFVESQPALSNVLRENTKGNTWRHLFESPKLSPWARDTSDIMVESRRKREISIKFLILCNLFPPLLFLYATGQMDGVMVWWTDNDHKTFTPRQKYYAWVCLTLWMVVVFLGLVAFLVVFFEKIHG